MNYLLLAMTFPACMVHVLPVQSCIPNLFVIFQLVFHNNDPVISAYPYLRTRVVMSEPP